MTAVTDFEACLTALRAAGESSRLRVLLLLAPGELTVSEVTTALGQSQPRVSRHLKVLAEAGLVKRHQEGAWTFYRLAEHPFLTSLGIVPGQMSPLMSADDGDALAAIADSRAAVAARYFRAHAAQWDNLRSRHVDEGEVERALLAAAPDQIGSFIDFGTGTGRMLTLFADRYDRGLGFDASPEMLAIARAKLADDGVQHAQVRLLDFFGLDQDEIADVICIHHVLHFLVDPGAAIKVATSALKPGGALLVADFAAHDHEDLRTDHAHRRLGFEQGEMNRWARGAGLVAGAAQQLLPPVKDGLITWVWRFDKPSIPSNGTVRKKKKRADVLA